MEPYVDNVSDEPLIKEELMAKKIISEDDLEELGTSRIVLENGIEVYLKKTNFKNDEILFSAISHGGQSMYSEDDLPTIQFVDDIVGEAGIGNFDNTQLSKLLAGKTLAVSSYIGEYTEGVRGSCSPDDLETFLQLVYLTFTAPRKDEKSFNSYISKEKSIYRNILSNPNYYFFDQVMKISFDNNPRRRFPTVDDYDKLDLDRAIEIYKERFADANDFKFSIVGNFESSQMKELLAKYLGNLPVLEEAESYKSMNINYLDGTIEKDLSKGKAPKTFVNMTYHGKMKYTKDEVFKLNMMAEVLKIRLRESMREDKGGVYGVRVSASPSKIPEEQYSITISFNTDPAKAQELIETAFQDIENTQNNATDEDTLNKVKETQRQERIKSLKQNRFWNALLRNAFVNESDPNDIDLDFLEQSLQSLTGDDIKAAANKYLDKNKFIKVVMSPESIGQ